MIFHINIDSVGSLSSPQACIRGKVLTEKYELGFGSEKNSSYGNCHLFRTTKTKLKVRTRGSLSIRTDGCGSTTEFCRLLCYHIDELVFNYLFSRFWLVFHHLRMTNRRNSIQKLITKDEICKGVL
jgi:hypothetical protein